MDVFTAGDILRLRVISRSAGLEVADCYVQVDTQVSKDATSQVWNVTRLADPAGGADTAGTVVHRGAVVLDYGQSRDGYWEVTCLDTTNGPYAQIATWDTTPASAMVRARIGQLSGIFAEGDEWGLFAGDHAAGNYLRASGQGLDLHVGGGNVSLDGDGIVVNGDQLEYYNTNGMRWVDSLGNETAKVSSGLWWSGAHPVMRLKMNGDDAYTSSLIELSTQGSTAYDAADFEVYSGDTYSRVSTSVHNTVHSALLTVATDLDAMPARIEMRIDNVTEFYLWQNALHLATPITWAATGEEYATADVNLYRGGADTLKTDDSLEVGGNLTVTGTLDLTSTTTWNNGVTLQAKNAAGTAEKWMWPRWTDDCMYTNFGSAGWKIRTNASGAVLTFDADGDATFARTVTSTLGFSGPNVTSGADPGHTHSAYSLTSHNHDHGALTGRADDDHPQYLLASGARALTSNWDAGSYYIRASYFYSDVATGTRPLVCTSTTTCTNLNADLLDGNHASAFATSGHTHTSLGAVTHSGQVTLSYAGATVQARTTAGGADSAFVLMESTTYKYGHCYSTCSNKFYVWSGPLATAIYEILDTGTAIRANTTWSDNAFDWVCPACGWHGADRPGGIGNAAGDQCPECGGLVEWHDDAELLHLAVHQPQGVALDRMEKLGVLSRHEDGQVFMALQTAHLFSWPAIAQLWERLRAAEARVAVLEGRL